MCPMCDWTAGPWGHVLTPQPPVWRFGFQLQVRLYQSSSQTADSSPVPHFSSEEDLLAGQLPPPPPVIRTASHTPLRFFFYLFVRIRREFRVWNLSRASEGSKSVALRKELISSAGSQAVGVCVCVCRPKPMGSPAGWRLQKQSEPSDSAKFRCV